MLYLDPPLKVTDFRCISDNWEDLICTWTEPWNPARTNYDFSLKAPGLEYILFKLIFTEKHSI